jgi:hypothetical protein
MLSGSSRFEADAHEFVAIFWGHGRGFGEQEGFSKGFRKGAAKKLAEASLAATLQTAVSMRVRGPVAPSLGKSPQRQQSQRERLSR